jgi:hypothetical protein
VAIAAAAPAGADVRVDAKPGLTPAIRPGVSDHVSRCGKGRPLRLSVDAGDGEKVSVDGRPARGGTFDAGDAATFVFELVVGAVLWGALGAAIGGVLTNQVGAIIATLAELFVVESIVAGIRPHVGRWLPGQAMFNGLLAHGGGSDHLAPGAGAAVTVAYLAAFAAAGVALTVRRDVT